MPYTVKKNHGKCTGDKPYATVKDDDGTIMGCHETADAAGSQIGAIEANEKKEQSTEDSENKERFLTEDDLSGKKSVYDWYVPHGATSFQQLDDMKDAAKRAKSVRNLTEQFQGLVENIVSDSEIGNKGLAIRALTEEYTKRLSSMEDNNDDDMEKSVQKALDQIDAELLITKGSDGTYYWEAVYSNNKKDRDNPPETISTKSHESYVKMVEMGIVPLPELWHWHIPNSKWGQATEVWFDQKGRARAKGYILKNHEHAAEALMGRTDIRVSHGMPKSLIKRDKRDNSTIIRHATVEISDLPAEAAANEYTGFVVMKGKTDMQLTDEQKKYLKELGYSEAEFPTFETLASNKDLKEKSNGSNGDDDQEGSDNDDNDASEDTQYTTREEVADAVSEITDGLTKAIADLTKGFVDLSARVNGMLESDKDKVADKAAKTPPASLKSLILQRVSESSNTAISPDSSLAKSAPRQTEQENKGDTGMFFEEWLNNG